MSEPYRQTQNTLSDRFGEEMHDFLIVLAGIAGYLFIGFVGGVIVARISLGRPSPEWGEDKNESWAEAITMGMLMWPLILIVGLIALFKEGTFRLSKGIGKRLKMPTWSRGPQDSFSADGDEAVDTES